MLANQTDCVGESAIFAVKHRPPDQSHDLKVCKRCGGASVRVAALSKSIDGPAYEIFQCPDCESIAWISWAHRNL